jgi:hypothetical protein
MNYYFTYDAQNISRVFGALITVLFFGLLFGSAPVLAAITPDVKTIVVVDGFGVSQIEDSSTRRAMTTLLTTSPVLSEENIKKVATDYLTSHLQDKVSVLAWDYHTAGNLPKGESTLLLRLDYTAWPQEVDGKSVTVGAIAVHVMRLLKDGFRCFNNDSDFQPVDSFVITDDAAQTQHNLEDAIGRLLFRYGAVQQEALPTK